MSNPWPKVKLGAVLGLSDRAVPSSSLPEVTLAGVYSFGRGLFRRGPMAPGSTSYKSYNCLVAGDFVISQPKAWEGAIALVTDEFEGMFLSPVFPTFQANKGKLLPEYLAWFAKRPVVWTLLRRDARGMGARRETVSPEQFLSLEIPLPPLDEQQRIVAYLDALSARITQARTLRQQATEEAGAIMLGARAAYYDQAARKHGLRPLTDVCVRITDGTHVTPTYMETGVPFLSVKDISTGTIRFDDCRYIASKEHAELTKRCKPERGDVLLTKVGTTGFAKAIDVDREFSIFVSLALLKLRKEAVGPDFVEQMLNSTRLRGQSQAGTRGVGNKNLVLKFIRQFPMPVPPLQEQCRIVAELDALEAKVDALKRVQAETAAELDALQSAALDRAFKGEL